MHLPKAVVPLTVRVTLVLSIADTEEYEPTTQMKINSTHPNAKLNLIHANKAETCKSVPFQCFTNVS